MKQSKSEDVSIRNLYPSLSEEELRKAEESLRRYFKIALEICEEQGPEPDTQFDTADTSPTMEERSKVSLKS